MRTVPVILLLGALPLAGCGDVGTTTRPFGAPPVPEAVRDMAAPGQNVESARLLPEDGCYWYEHRGPVETTLLPLRTSRGNPICIKQETPPEPAAT